MPTKSHGVSARSTAARSAASHVPIGEPGEGSCSLEIIATCTLPTEKLCQKTPFDEPDAGMRKRRSVPTPHSPCESTPPFQKEGDHMRPAPEGSRDDGPS